jgi:hypothetical protein
MGLEMRGAGLVMGRCWDIMEKLESGRRRSRSGLFVGVVDLEERRE